MKNLSIEGIANCCNGVIYGKEWIDSSEKTIKGVVIDSRLMEEDYLFIATKGEKVDGHSFITQVFQKKAMAVVCEQLPEVILGPCILVKDSFLALKEIATFYREQLSIPIIGISGSVGKTSTKECVASVLEKKFHVLKTNGNYNNEIGLPLTILRIREEHEIAVLEMGISDFNEMHRLSQIAKPNICLLTNIGPCHLECLGDLDGVLKAKTEMFDFAKENFIVCINGDDKKLATLKEKKELSLYTFGLQSENDVYAKTIKDLGLFGSEVEISSTYEGNTSINKTMIPLPGNHMVYNALAATLIGTIFQISPQEIAVGIAETESIKGRSNILKMKDYIVIDDCYNANPISMESALCLLERANSRKVAVLGDMFELGEKQIELHRKIGKIAIEKADVVVCVGILSRHMKEEACKENRMGKEIFYFETIQELIKNWNEIIQTGDSVLLKASHGMKFEEILKEIQ